MKAIRKQVILQSVEQEKTTASGIVLQGSTGEQTPGVVISCGHEVSEVDKGDRVIVDWRHARPFKFNDQQYYVVDLANIIAVYDQE